MLKQLSSCNKKDQYDIHSYIIGLLLSQCIMVSNKNHLSVGHEDSKNNYVLPFKHAALSVLLEILDLAPEKVIQDMSLQIV
jgi:hypothetical protein